MLERVLFRRATFDDLVCITKIYNQAIEAGRNTCDTKSFSVEERQNWFKINENDRTPIIVAELDKQVIGYSYLSLYRGGRPAVSNVAEISYYLDFDYLGKGIGKKLFEYTVERAKELKYSHLIAILISNNIASIALLEKQGFEKWGEMPNIVRLEKGVCSHLYYGKKLEL